MIELKAPAMPISGSISLPPSKSLANRQLILQFLQKKEIPRSSLNEPGDVRVLKNALNLINQRAGSVIDVGPAGTAMRFLCACLCLQDGEWTLTGSTRMQDRPIAPLVTALNALGADITYLTKVGFPPLKIVGRKLIGKKISVPANFSSQYISALMLIAPFIQNGLEIELLNVPVSEPYLQMTVRLLEQYGANVLQVKNTFKIEGGQVDEHDMPGIEGDWSAASYYYSMVALSPGSQLRLLGLNKNSLQGDSVVQRIFIDLGVTSRFDENGVHLSHQKCLLEKFEMNCIDFPDLAQTLALTCLGLGLPAYLTGLQTLKIKETDRLQALKHELEKFGAKVDITDNSLRLSPGISNSLAPIRIETYDDHRMAMSFAPLSLLGHSLIFAQPEVVAKSYPDFWEHLKSLGFNVNLQTL